jgi:hypothetical protein
MGTTVRLACWLPWFPTKITIHQAVFVQNERKKLSSTNLILYLKLLQEFSGKMAKMFAAQDRSSLLPKQIKLTTSQFAKFSL